MDENIFEGYTFGKGEPVLTRIVSVERQPADTVFKGKAINPKASVVVVSTEGSAEYPNPRRTFIATLPEDKRITPNSKLGKFVRKYRSLPKVGLEVELSKIGKYWNISIE